MCLVQQSSHPSGPLSFYVCYWSLKIPKLFTSKMLSGFHSTLLGARRNKESLTLKEFSQLILKITTFKRYLGFPEKTQYTWKEPGIQCTTSWLAWWGVHCWKDTKTADSRVNGQSCTGLQSWLVNLIHGFTNKVFIPLRSFDSGSLQFLRMF